MEEGKGERYLASGRQYGNALLGVRHQEEEEEEVILILSIFNGRQTESLYPQHTHPPTLTALAHTERILKQNVFTGWMCFLSPNQQLQSIEGTKPSQSTFVVSMYNRKVNRN